MLGSGMEILDSMGRAIRHINDYAAILLVDTRYACDSSKRSFPHPITKLPQWIKDCLVSSTNNYGEVHRLVHQFFKSKNTSCQ
ncbi:putative DNA helicase [Lupinus albus]|uniref:Putative DNA helicase n=1 Tax=Lupinus albus TaxID=3870 RepID=A0A6A4ND84_LUPAL|nr:putative DNA helicase [Lupinus albus]